MEPALSAAVEIFAAARRLPSDPGAPLARRLAARGCEGFARHRALEDDVFLLLVGTTPRAIRAPLAAVQLARARLRHPGASRGANDANASLDALAAAGLVGGEAAAWPPAAFALGPGTARPRFFATLAGLCEAEGAAALAGGVCVWSGGPRGPSLAEEGGAWGLLAWRAGGALFSGAARAWGYAAATGALLERAEAPGVPAFRPAALQPCPFAVAVRREQGERRVVRFARRGAAALFAARRGGVVVGSA